MRGGAPAGNDTAKSREAARMLMRLLRLIASPDL